MGKIQGKQIADSAIQQRNLYLSTPASGDTLSGATVEYVNQFVQEKLANVATGNTGVIGDPEDGTYTDGLFPDFTPTTLIGTAIDRFNEVLLKLAPTPPSDNWDNVFTNLTMSATNYDGMRALTTGSVVNNIYTTTTPGTITITSLVSTGVASKSLNNFTFELLDNAVSLESVTINSGSTTKNTGYIRYTIADPYSGQAGKENFWTGVTTFSLAGNLPAITPSSSQRTLTLTHPGSDSPETYNYYVDSVSAPTVTALVATMPSMTKYVSGVPTLDNGDTITNVGFTVNNAVSYFYNPSFYDIYGSYITADNANAPTSIPTTFGQSVSESGLNVTVGNGFNDTSFSFSVRGRNIAGSTGTIATYNTTSSRIDTVSNEAIRRTSGSGNYPSASYNGVYDSIQSLVGTYTEELQLKNGIYQYPTVDYTAVGGPDYSSATGLRWATFNIGTFNNNSAFTLTINGTSTGINNITQSGLYIEVKIDGAGSSYWVDGNSSYSGSGDPGSSSDGVAAVVVGSSTATARRITFGSVVHSGSIIVRIGWNESQNFQFTSLTSSAIV